MNSTTITVRARGLRKRYGDLVAVDGIDFTIRAGECFGFLGPNGAGKTTTMRMIGCSAPVGEGELRVLDLDVRRDAREVKRQLGVVPQADNLDQELTVRQNLDLYGRYFDLPGVVRRERVNRLLEFVQLAERGDVKVETLSGGMRRRLLVARGLVNDPRLVVLDEPTTGLDPQARHMVWEKLRQLRGEERTLVLTTHYMDEAEQLCDRLVIMEKGRIIAEGAPRALIRDIVPRDVVEIRGSAEVRERVRARYDGKVETVEIHEERVLLFTGDGDALLHDLAEQRIDHAEVYARRSTLEDVFLKLTGRSLGE